MRCRAAAGRGVSGHRAAGSAWQEAALSSSAGAVQDVSAPLGN